MKEEEVWLQEYSSFAETKAAIESYIRSYNTDRPHSPPGYRSPLEFRNWKMQHNAA
ncbi:IS3 family transposase [Alicyclobacillus macrosporangiidus]|uniref:IS3 family transposase n=1 Tax=Alicyclobacillus macrosporangiidus TaxID=392015 RepID=UPI00111365B9